MAIGFTTVHDEAGLVVACINHRHELLYSALPAAITLDRRLSIDCGKGLLSCLVDFILQPAMLKFAIGPRPMLAIPR